MTLEQLNNILNLMGLKIVFENSCVYFYNLENNHKMISYYQVEDNNRFNMRNITSASIKTLFDGRITFYVSNPNKVYKMKMKYDDDSFYVSEIEKIDRTFKEDPKGIYINDLSVNPHKKYLINVTSKSSLNGKLKDNSYASLEYNGINNNPSVKIGWTSSAIHVEYKFEDDNYDSLFINNNECLLHANITLNDVCNNNIAKTFLSTLAPEIVNIGIDPNELEDKQLF